ncbi:MAG: LLM class flavin-dependent oxidoreductase [Armatimonadota bacterium]|nr:LLM class flavin-dependent oxidoreductase [Armatimonadota bacterium]
MSDPVRFGVIILQSLPWRALVERWRLIDDLGFDSAWLPDHFVNPRGPIDHWYECWTTLAALAVHTRRMRVGTLVTTITLRTPALLARMALTVDHISGGRLDLGIGAGGAMKDHTMTGITPWPRPERFRRFREYVTVLDLLLRQERTSFDGRHYTLADASMQPAPLQRPRVPIMIGGKSPSLLRAVAAVGDAWNTNGGRDLEPAEALRVTRERGAMLDEFCLARGRDPREVRRSFMMGQTRDQVLASMTAFQDFVGRYRELGFSEFILFWLRDPNPDYPLYSWITNRAMLERVATAWIPTLRG